MRGLGVALVLAAVLAVYLPHVQQAGFVYEDERVRYQHDSVGMAGMVSGRGLTVESWRYVRTAGAAHGLNLMLHLLVTTLAGALLWRVTGDGFVGLGAASLVALHPVAMEGVAYAASRAELIAAVGALIALHGVLCRWPIGLAVAAAGVWLAWLGKETGAVALLLMPMILWYTRDRRLEGLLWIIGGALAVTSAVWWSYAVTLPTLGETPRLRVDGLSWVLTQAEAVWRLVVLSVAPFWLSVDHGTAPRLWSSLVALLLLAALLECAWRARQRHPLFTLGVCWCALVAAPRFLVRTPLSPFNEHQWYLALPGVACVWLAAIQVAAAWGEARWGRRPCPA